MARSQPGAGRGRGRGITGSRAEGRSPGIEHQSPFPLASLGGVSSLGSPQGCWGREVAQSPGPFRQVELREPSQRGAPGPVLAGWSAWGVCLSRVPSPLPASPGTQHKPTRSRQQATRRKGGGHSAPRVRLHWGRPHLVPVPALLPLCFLLVRILGSSGDGSIAMSLPPT